MFTTFSVYGFRKIQINWKLMMVLLCTVLSGYYLYIKMGPDKNIETYYFSEEGMVERVEMHVWSVPIYTYKKYSGFWGQGLGISVHGAGYLVPDKPRGWQEGALGKVFMELGVPGAITLLYSGIVLMWTFFVLIKKCHIFLSESEALFLFGSVAFFLSNLGQFLVSFQIMGDPFIASFLTIIAGLSLSLTKYSDKKLEL
jgi:hypothetical protein